MSTIKMAILGTLFSAFNTYADQWVPAGPFEKAFGNGVIKVRVQTPITEGASPLAEVTKKTNGSTVKICSGDLVNKRRPADVFVGQDGRALVTVDEWGRAGYEHALVFYRCDVKLHLKKDYSLEDFLSPSEIADNTQTTMSSRFWAKDAKFEIERETFTVGFKSGLKFKFALADGALRTEKRGN